MAKTVKFEVKIKNDGGGVLKNIVVEASNADEAIGRIVESASQATDILRRMADSAISRAPLSETMRQRLSESNFIFSGFKTFHSLNEAFPSMVDANGDLKPFERFLNDVQKIDRQYNVNYLRAEYNFAVASAESAARWEEIEAGGDRYDLQYRTAGDGRVRPEHAALDKVTLPVSSPFWDSFMPPNGWNCRCSVVQVRKGKYPTTDIAEAIERGEKATVKDKRGMMRFNPGKERSVWPKYNPYTIRRCRDCDSASGSATLAKFIPENEVCEVCRFLRTCRNYDTTKRVWEYIKELKEEAPIIDNTHIANLKTNSYYQTRKSFKRAIGHARDLEEAEMYKNIYEQLSNLDFLCYSPLGEGKDITNQRDNKNVDSKQHRGVSGYNIYSLNQGGETWIITMEVYKNRSETIYPILKKK